MIARDDLVAAAVLILAIFATFDQAQADGNPQNGAKIYGACAACHSLEPDLQLTGPSLAGIWGRKAASVAGFARYSRALKERDVVWDGVSLNAWIADPQALVPGTYMTFRGIDDDKARGDLLAFLELALAPDGAKSTVAQGLITAEEARGQAPAALEGAGPEAQVTAIRYCQNSFFVITADGKEHPFWEMNMRLKIDASAQGPKGGKPVLVGAGMQGDRASIIFSDVADIGRWVEKKC